MSYDDAFDAAVSANMETREHIRIYKIDGMYWATTMLASPHSSAILIGEVRRMCQR